MPHWTYDPQARRASALLSAPTRLKLKLLHFAELDAWSARAVDEWMGARAEPEPEGRRLESPAHAAARTELRKLLRMEDGDRLRALEVARTRFRSPELAALLLEEVRQNLDDPAEAWALAELAEKVAYRAGSADLQALAAGHQANARRAAGDLNAADELMRRAGHLLRLAQSSDLVRAELYSLEGSLRKDQRAFPAALRLLADALALYETAGTAVEQARTLLQLAELHWTSEAPASAAATLEAALPLLDPFRSPRLHRQAHHNLVLYLADSGDASLAAALLDLIRPLYKSASPLTLHRLHWLEGHLARLRDDTDTAEVILRNLLDELIADNYPLLAAFVALELSELYLETGQILGLRRLTGLLPAIFNSQRLDRESAAAILLLAKAAATEEMTVETVVKIRQQLMRVP